MLASHLQRYALRCRKKTTLYMWGVPKDTLLSEAGYTTYVKERIEQGQRWSGRGGWDRVGGGVGGRWSG